MSRSRKERGKAEPIMGVEDSTGNDEMGGNGAEFGDDASGMGETGRYHLPSPAVAYLDLAYGVTYPMGRIRRASRNHRSLPIA